MGKGQCFNVLFSSRVIKEELKEVPSEDVKSLTPLTVKVKSVPEQKVVDQLSEMIRIIGDTFKDHKEFQE